MKKKFFLAISFMMLFAFVSYSQDKGLARVKKILGKEVYVMCEPVKEYEIVEQMSTELGTALLGRGAIDKEMEDVINRGLKRIKKGKMKEFDGVLSEDGDKIVFIKFK